MFIRNTVALFSVFLSAFLSLPAWAAPGDLDTSFGGGKGWVETPFLSESASNSGRAVIRQLDGKLVVAGDSDFGGGIDSIFALARYNSDGSLDTTFDTDGIATTRIGGVSGAYSLIQQVDGKLVAAGYGSNGSNDDFALVRYNSDGSLDTTFGINGKATTAIGTGFEYARSVIQQVDGKLVAAGYSSNGGNDDFALVRYNSDGSLDSTFDMDGKVTTAIGTGRERAYSVIQQTDGKLVAAGGNNLVRYNDNGTLDTSFGADGIVSTEASIYSVIQQVDDKLVVAGGSSGYFALVRYNGDGSLDTTFDIDGMLTTLVGSKGTAYSVIQQTDGKLVAAGHGYDGGTKYDFALVRYNSDGSLDTTFSGDGKLITSFGTWGNSRSSSVIQQTDGKLVAVGFFENGIRLEDFALARYSSDGSLDTTFDTDGKVATDALISNAKAQSMIQQSDGKLVVAGSSVKAATWDFALARYSSDGSLDTTFDTDGKLSMGINAMDEAHTVIQQSDGKLVAAGGSGISGASDFVLVRYNSDGSLDTSFSADGIVTTAIGSLGDVAYSLIQQADGKLVAAGSSYNGSNSDFGLVRYNSDGSLDGAFGMGGIVATAIGMGNDDYANSLIQQPDGKLVVAGNSGSKAVVVRYNNNGSLDTTFDGDGIATTYFRAFVAVYSVIQQADGKLVAAGYIGNDGGKTDIALVRYNSDGSLDTTFGDHGIVITVVGSGDDQAYSVIQQADSKLVVAGYSYNGSNNDFVLVRYKADGSLDIKFNGDGIATTAIGAGADQAYSVIQQPDGKLVVAGYADGQLDGENFVLARYESAAPNAPADTDTDEVADGSDNCPLNANTDQIDTDADGEGDACDSDDDNDFVPDSYDNCPLIANAGQDDYDWDDIGDNCDEDKDSDGVLDISDAFPFDETEWVDTDSDGIGNNADQDDDNDGTPDEIDNDADNDGTPDYIDAEPLNPANSSELLLPLDGVFTGSGILEEMSPR